MISGAAPRQNNTNNLNDFQVQIGIQRVHDQNDSQDDNKIELIEDDAESNPSEDSSSIESCQAQHQDAEVLEEGKQQVVPDHQERHEGEQRNAEVAVANNRDLFINAFIGQMRAVRDAAELMLEDQDQFADAAAAVPLQKCDAGTGL